MPKLFDLNLSFSLISSKLIFFWLNNKLPEEGLSIKDKMFNKVDLPEPDGPTKE